MQRSAQSVEELFFAALELKGAEARSAFLDRHCQDTELRRRVVELLAGDAQGSSFLEAPASLPTVTVAPDSRPGVEEPGTIIGSYKLLEQIGEGGMGLVFMAEQTRPVRRKVALKIIKAGMDTKQVIARFEVERQALALMDHPNIARVHDAGTTDSGRPYFVMELVRGIPITEYCDREQLGISERLELFVLVCRAVQHAHQKGIIHRDLKPSNILVTVVDGVAVPKLVDFGVAKATGGSLTERTLFTGFHQFVGTPLYMSPEQADLAGVDVDTRSDIYALGVLLYELLTGTTPFDQETFRKAAFDELRRIIREEEPPRPSTRLSTLGATLSTVSARRKSDPRRLGSALRGELDWIVMKALEKDRKRRYETANDFAADVMRYLTEKPVEACPPSAWYRFTKFVRRNRAVLTTVGLLSITAVAAVAIGTALVWREKEQTRRALFQSQAHAKTADERLSLARKAVDEMYTQVAQKWLSLGGGLTPIQREFLEKALAFYEEFARERADDPEAQAEAAQAASRVGEIRSQLGQSDGALEAHQRALDAFRRLAAGFPDWPDYQRGMACSLHDIGAVQELLGRTREAEESLRQATALWQDLAEASGLPDDRAEWAVSLRSQADLLGGTHRTAEGERLALRGIELISRLVDELPQESRFRRLLASAEMHLGRLLSFALSCYGSAYNGRIGEAEGRYRRALGLLEELAESEPAEPEHQLSLAECHDNLAYHYGAVGRPQEALAEYRRALPLEEVLVRNHPERPQYRALLARSLVWTSVVLVRLGEFEEAERTVRRSLAVSERLTIDFPDVPGYRQELAIGSLNLGSILTRLGRVREASQAHVRAREIQRELATDHSDRPRYRPYLALAEEKALWKGLALAEYRAGNLDAALKAGTKTLELGKNGGDWPDWLVLALIHLGRGDREQARHWALGVFQVQIQFITSRWPEYLSLFREHEARLKELLPTDAEGLCAALAHALEVQRRAEGRLGDYRGWLVDQLGTLGHYGEATALLQEALRLDPDHKPHSWLHFCLGVLALHRGDWEAHRAVCTELLREYASQDTTAKEGLSNVKQLGPEQAAQAAANVRLCAAVPEAGQDPKRLLELSRRAATANDQDAAILLARGAAEYRAGQFAAAVEVLTRALARFQEQPADELAQHQSWPYLGSAGRAQAHLLLAMAHHRLGHAQEARRALADADRALAEVLDQPDSEPRRWPWSWRWSERVLAEVLRRDAGELLGIPLSTASND
jgi:serine/threonine protein kinase